MVVVCMGILTVYMILSGKRSFKWLGSARVYSRFI